jgi:hypothetical protein
VELVHRLRQLDLKKHPSISETLDWARALVTLNAHVLDRQVLETTLAVLVKHESDLARTRHAIVRSGPNGNAGEEPAAARPRLGRGSTREGRYGPANG